MSVALPDVRPAGVETAGGETSAMPVVLLVLLVIMVFSLLAGPRVLADAPLIAWVSMTAVFVTASAAAIISIVEPGEAISVTIDKARGLVVLEQSGLFARSVRHVRFQEIETFRIESRTDKGGFVAAIPMIVLKSQRTLPLPAGTSETDIASMREMVREA